MHAFSVRSCSFEDLRITSGSNSAIRFFLFLSLLMVFAGCKPEPADSYARAYLIEDLSQTIGGPKAMAHEGDFVMENEFLRQKTSRWVSKL